MPYLEITELVLIHCNVVKNSYQQNSLLDISPNNFIFSKTFDSEFSNIEVWFPD